MVRKTIISQGLVAVKSYAGEIRRQDDSDPLPKRAANLLLLLPQSGSQRPVTAASRSAVLERDHWLAWILHAES
jgi:hypothetical protein